jgi:hypothetical protein
MTATKPALSSALNGYWGSDGSQHVTFIGIDDFVHELYIAPGAAGWVVNDLTALTEPGTPGAYATALDGYWGSDGSQHVNFIGADDHVHELYITPGTGWVHNDLTALAGAVAPKVGRALVGYWGSDSSQHVNFIGTDDHVHELYISPGTAWVDNDLTKLAGAVLPAVETALDGYWGSDSSVHVDFIGTDDHVHELYITPGAGWVDNDLTKMAGGQLPAAGTELVGYWGSDNSQHVNFFGASFDNHVQELYIAPNAAGWVQNDLTTLADGFVPVVGRALDGYWGSDSSVHVHYIGSDVHVRELYIAPGATGWVDHDLTTLAGAPLAAVDTALNGYWGSDSSQHVNYIGSDEHVHELCIAPGTGWVHHDLTALA